MKWFDLSESKDDKDSIMEIITWLEKTYNQQQKQ